MTARRLLAEGLGTGFLAMAAIGAGIMADRLTADPALALLAIGICSGLALFVLITVMIPVSGGHLNPVVTLTFALRHEITPGLALAYVAAQAAGAVAGVLAVHAMFDLPLWQISQTARTGGGLWLSEGIATFGLILVTLGALAAWANVPAIVGTYIAAAFWFTASSSFANPAVMLARILTDSPGGIRMQDFPGYLAAQILGTLVAVALGGWLFGRPVPPAESR